MNTTKELPCMNRRAAILWMLGASATLSPQGARLLAAENSVSAKGYGPDPNVVKIYNPGDVWPLTLSAGQRRAAQALCDVIIPADDISPSASAVHVHEFIDEWVSSPYPAQASDRVAIRQGLLWLDEESKRRFLKVFADLTPDQQTAICADLAEDGQKPQYRQAAAFFKRFRDLAAGGYYTTLEGMKAIGYVGNIPSATFDGPSREALAHVGLL